MCIFMYVDVCMNLSIHTCKNTCIYMHTEYL